MFNKIISFSIKFLVFSLSFPTFTFGMMMIFFGDWWVSFSLGQFAWLVLLGVGPAFLGGFVMKKIVFNGKDYLVFKEINQNLENKNLKTLQSAPKTDKNSLIHQVFYELLEERHGKVTSLNLELTKKYILFIRPLS